MIANVVYRSGSGRALTTDDLFTSWEKRKPSAPTPPEAVALHEQGRNAGAAGDYQRALDQFGQAHTLAPDWAYPLYDIAFTYLLTEDTAKAEGYYATVDRMEPRGFFTCKTFLDALRRERLGSLPPRFCKAFFLLEGMPKPQKKTVLRQIGEKFPDFPPVWKELSAVLDDPDERLVTIERGLELEPDGETLGMLIINKALILSQRNDQEQAVCLLGELALDQQATMHAEMLAKLVLRQIFRVPDRQ
jgi:tetratricopeptide (TPR) repeat protein